MIAPGLRRVKTQVLSWRIEYYPTPPDGNMVKAANLRSATSPDAARCNAVDATATIQAHFNLRSRRLAIRPRGLFARGPP